MDHIKRWLHMLELGDKNSGLCSLVSMNWTAEPSWEGFDFSLHVYLGKQARRSSYLAVHSVFCYLLAGAWCGCREQTHRFVVERKEAHGSALL